MIRTASILGSVSILVLVGAAGCSSESAAGKAPAHAAVQTVTPSMHVVSTARAEITANTVVGIIGSYHTCQDQPDGTSWVLDTAGNAGAMETLTGFAAPALELNDTKCALQIDSINTSIGYTSTDQPTALVFSGTTVTPNTYLASAVGFDAPDGGPLSFYANAQATITNASSDFGLTILVGDGPTTGSSSTTAAPQTVTGTLSSVGDVPGPNYTTDFSSFTLEDDVNGVASTVSGTVNLDFDSQDGELYLVVKGQDLSTMTFSQVDALFKGDSGTPIAIPAGNGTVQVTATSLVATGDTLSETSTIVVQHIDTASQVTTYEVLAITFNPHSS